MKLRKLLTIQAAALGIALTGISMVHAEIHKETLDSIKIQKLLLLKISNTIQKSIIKFKYYVT